MKKTICYFIIALSIIAPRAKAQTLDQAVINRFDAGTLAKVLDWAVYTNLTPSQQWKMASIYSTSDSLGKVKLLRGATLIEFEGKHEEDRENAYHILTYAQQVEYEGKAGKRFGRIAADAEMEFLREKYQPDSISYDYMQKLFSDKYGFLYERYLSGGKNDGYAKSKAKEILKWYDGFAIYPTLHAGKFVGDYINTIRAIKYIPDSTINKIKGTFLITARNNKNADWGRILTDITRLFLPDTAVFSTLNHNQLSIEAINKTAVDRYNLVHIHHISVAAYDSVFDLVRTKNYKNAVLEYTYSEPYKGLCDSLIDKNSRYYDSAIEASLIRDGSMQTGSQFSLALKNKKWLKLRPELTDTLVYHAMVVSKQRDLASLTNPFGYLDMDDYESRVLGSLLTEEEYTNLLMLKNQPQAFTDAKKDWAELEKRNLVQGLVKQSTLEQVTSYYIARYSAWNRLAYDKDAQMANVRTLEDNKPQALKILEAAMWNPTPVKANNNLKLQW